MFRPVPSPPTELSLRPALAAMAAVALLAVGVWVGVLVGGAGGGGAPKGGARLALSPVGAGARGASGVAVVTAGRDARLRLSIAGLRATRGDSFYEVWESNGPRDLVSVGGFRASSGARTVFSAALPVDPAGYRAIEVSLERADGDPGRSGELVLRAKLPARTG